jgi:hypothetical protein
LCVFYIHITKCTTKTQDIIGRSKKSWCFLGLSLKKIVNISFFCLGYFLGYLWSCLALLGSVLKKRNPKNEVLDGSSVFPRVQELSKKCVLDISWDILVVSWQFFDLSWT